MGLAKPLATASDSGRRIEIILADYVPFRADNMSRYRRLIRQPFVGVHWKPPESWKSVVELCESTGENGDRLSACKRAITDHRIAPIAPANGRTTY
jgi:hypothetical protein